MLLLFLLGLALSAVSPSHEEELALKQGSCPMFWYSFNNRCYKYIATQMDWSDAERHCVSQGANLVSIHSEEENNFVKLLIKNFDLAENPTWIGLNDGQNDGVWLWSDGSKFSFSFWNPGEPNNSGGNEECAHTNWGSPKKWNDISCSNSYPFVCASRTDCPIVRDTN